MPGRTPQVLGMPALSWEGTRGHGGADRAPAGLAWAHRAARLRRRRAAASVAGGQGAALTPWASTLRQTVTAMTDTASSATGPSASSASSAKTRDASPRGPNQPTNSTVSGRAGTNRAQRDRHHPHEREAQHGVQQGQGSECVDHDRHGDGTEGQPHQQGDQPARLFEEQQLGGAALPGARAEREPAAEGRDEAVAVQTATTARRRAAPGPARRCRRSPRQPSPARRARRSSQPPPKPTAMPTPAPISSSTAALPASSALSEACGGGRAGDREHDDRGGDAVVEAALDGDQLADARRHHRVRHHGHPQRGVGGGQRRADEQGQPQPERREEPGGQAPPEHDRSAAGRWPAAARSGPTSRAQLMHAEAGGVGEQHPHQGDLDQRRDRLRRRGAWTSPAPARPRRPR